MDSVYTGSYGLVGNGDPGANVVLLEELDDRLKYWERDGMVSAQTRRTLVYSRT